MATLNFNTFPYYDDFNATKRFHRMLFKPGYAVQARELTQLQTILQDQIKKFGDHIFVNGSVVVGCNETSNFNVPYVKIKDTDESGITISNTDLENFEEKIIECTATGVKARIKKVATGLEGNNPDLKTLYLQYTSVGTDNVTSTFTSNDVLAVEGTGETFIVADVSESTGTGSLFSIGNGVVYYNGNFIINEEQTIILEKYQSSPSKKVGFVINETVITADDDITLLDPARGSYNYAAPGADRFNLTTQLTSIDLAETIPEGFNILFEIDSGTIKRRYNVAQYGELNKALATRTFDESGDYTVKNFALIISEHKKTSINNGIYPDGNYSKLVLGVQPGKAYVKGYAYELYSTEYIDVDKGTDTDIKNNATIITSYENYVTVSVDDDDDVKMFPVSTYDYIYLRKADNAIVGTARVKDIEYNGVISENKTYKIYLYDVDIYSGFGFNQVTKISSQSSSTAATVLNVSTQPYNASKETMIFKNTYASLKSVSDTSYRYRAVVSTVTFTSGSATVSAPSGTTWIGNSSDFIVVDSTGKYRNITSVSGLGTSSVSITVSGDNPAGTTNTVSGIVKATTTQSNPKTLSPNRYVKLDISDKSTGSVTISSNTIAVADHNLSTGSAITIIKSGDTLPAPLAENTVYYVIKENNSTIKFASNLSNALLGNAIDITTAGTGTHIVRQVPNFNLGYYDVLKIENIWATSNEDAPYPSNPATDVNWVDVTSLFTLKNGQKDSKYDLASIIPTVTVNNLIPGAVAKKLVVKLTYFSHGSSAPFYSVSSYNLPAVDAAANSTQVEWYQIPKYTSSGGITYDLRDCIDFRSTVGATAIDSTTVSGATLNPGVGTTLLSGSVFPAPSSEFDYDVEYFLPRVDSVYLDSDGEFSIIKGISNINPSRPAIPNNAMQLGYVAIPPFPSLSPYMASVAGVSSSARVTSLDNRRFTMKDIGDIKKRMDNIEYYTSLSLLEKNAADITIVNEDTQEDRFKNGIFVDPFVGHNIGNITDLNYNCSISNGELRPAFTLENIELNYMSGTNVTRKSSDAIILVRTPSTTQFATNDVVSAGSVSGTVIHAVTIEVVSGQYRWQRLYLHNVTGSFAEGAAITSGTKTGTITAASLPAERWNPTNIPDLVVSPSEGNLITLKYNHRKFAENAAASKERNVSGNLLLSYSGTIELSPSSDNWFDTSNKVEILQNPNNIYDNWETLDNPWSTHWGDWETLWQGKSSVQQSIENTGGNVGETPEQRQRRMGSGIGVTNIISDFIVPYMRSRIVSFKGTHLKPNTRVYAYFDGRGVSEHCRLYSLLFSGTATGGSETSLSLTSATWLTNAFVNCKVTITSGKGAGQTRIIQTNTGTTLSITQAWNIVPDITSVFKVEKVNNFGDSLLVDSKGNIEGQFRIPSGTFTVGSKTFLLTDNNEDPEIGDLETIATATYTASGLSSFDEGNVLSTQQSDVTLLRQLQLQEPNVLRSLGGAATSEDPMAQTFFVTNVPQGTYLTKIDVYFKQKSTTEGITLQLREVVNGRPSDRILPYSTVSLQPKDVNVSNLADAVTQFVFPSPVYVKNDTEYCFVLLPAGNSDDYKVWVSELGKEKIGTTAIIDEQPYSGVLFAPSNSGNWVELTNEDIKFTIYSTDFEETGSLNLTLKNYDFLKLTNINETLEIGDAVVYTDGLATQGRGTVVYYDTVNNIAVIDVISGKATANQYVVSAKYQIPGITTTISTGSPNIQSAGGGYISSSDAKYVIQRNDILVRGDGSVIGTVSASGTLNNTAVALTANASLNDSSAIIFRGKKATISQVQQKGGNAISPSIGYLDFNNTDINWTYSIFSVGGSSVVNNSPVVSNTTTLPQESVAVFSKSSNIVLSTPSLTVSGVLSTTADHISPAIDISRLSFIVAGNQISAIPPVNAVDTEQNSDSEGVGTALSKYVSKTVTLEDGQEAEDLRVYLTAFIPAEADVKVYARLKNPTDPTLFTNRPWTRLVKTVPVSTTGFGEYYYSIPAGGTDTPEGGLITTGTDEGKYKYTSENGQTYTEYKTFAVKIVFYSNSAINVPVIRDMRAISLQV